MNCPCTAQAAQSAQRTKLTGQWMKYDGVNKYEINAALSLNKVSITFLFMQ
jgi:hypothetical protein